MWAFAGSAEALPPGDLPARRAAGRGRRRAGWRSAGRSAPTPSICTARRRRKRQARLVWPKGADRGARRAPRRRGVPGARPDQHAGLGYGAGRTRRGGEQVADKHRGAAPGDRRRRPARRELSDDPCRRPRQHAGAAADRPRWGDESAPKVTLVGKGVCFDTGGLDLKPASGMKMMKKDMGGAAIMLGLAQAIMAAGLPVRLRVLLPLVENAVSGNAMRPLDIVRTRKGLTVEIGNTDAEGRLILCDALAEACDREAGAAGRHRDPDRRRAGGARPGTAGAVLQRRRRRGAAAGGGRGGGRPAVAHAAVARLPPDARQQGGRPQQRVGRAACRRDHRGALSAGIRRARHPVGAYRRDGLERSAPGPAARKAARRRRCAPSTPISPGGSGSEASCRRTSEA